MLSSKKYHLTLLILLTALIIALSMFFYKQQITATLTKTTLNSMHELAAHDKGFVENTLDKQVVSLSLMGERLRLQRFTTIVQLQRQLNLEYTAGSFKYIFLIDKQGRMYSGTFLIQSGKKYPYVQALLQKTPLTIMRYNDLENRVDTQEETLAYALALTPFTIDGVEFIGIVGQTMLKDVRNHMTFTSFGGAGSSTVIDSEGYCIVNKSGTNGIGQQDNILEELSTATFSDGITMASLQEALHSRQTFNCRYAFQDQEYLLTMTPLELTDWYLLLTVPVEIFTRQSGHFVLMTTLILAIILLLVAALALTVFKTWQTSVRAKLQAKTQADFLNKMSHEIRTPLNALLGLNYLMRESLDDQEKLTDYLEKSATTSQYLLSLINDILDLSKLNQSAITLNNEAFSLPKMLELLQSIIKDRLEQKEITFTVSSKFIRPYIIGDSMRLKQVLLNILGNAAKFTPAHGSVTLELSQKQQSPTQVLTIISVTDSGIGMSKEFQQHIFESFSQEKNTAYQQNLSNEQGGTGLGMAISFLLMQQMHGKLKVTSTPGAGSCFTILLPATIASEAELPESKHLATSAPVPPKALQILIAEDNKLNAEILTQILHKSGYSSVTARNGQEAVTTFSQAPLHAFPVILMDAQMPVMDGFQAAQAIRKLPRSDAHTVHIYACTANTTQADRAKAVAAGMDGFIAKPIDVKKLLQILQELNIKA